MKKRFLSIAVVLIVVFLFPLNVYANSPPPSPWYIFILSDIPKEAVYADLLIELNEFDPHYESLVSDNMPDTFTEHAEILSYCEDNFRSYTFHCKNAKSEINIDCNNQVRFYMDITNYDESQDQYYKIVSEDSLLRLALLDENGDIIKVSPTLAIKPRQFMGSLSGVFHYNATTDNFVVESDINTFGVTLYGILCVCGMVFTCLIEYLLSIPFRLRKTYGLRILLVNLASQIAMHITYILLYSIVFWRYGFMVFLLELLVYSGEFFVYRKMMKDVSLARCLCYTITANTVSLVFGLLLIP